MPLSIYRPHLAFDPRIPSSLKRFKHGSFPRCPESLKFKFLAGGCPYPPLCALRNRSLAKFLRPLQVFPLRERDHNSDWLISDGNNAVCSLNSKHWLFFALLSSVSRYSLHCWCPSDGWVNVGDFGLLHIEQSHRSDAGEMWIDLTSKISIQYQPHLKVRVKATLRHPHTAYCRVDECLASKGSRTCQSICG